ncbi:hypothetical protein [Leeia sp.]|uniref:hypothetical protein n=1 Tax=Leeia sp. TaxID=2884678 RepID=UPI0035B05C91
MDLPRLEGFKRYWRQHPPLHLMIQSFLGIQQKDEPQDAPDLSALLNQFPQAGAGL